jgi:hypothetical protein
MGLPTLIGMEFNALVFVAAPCWAVGFVYAAEHEVAGLVLLHLAARLTQGANLATLRALCSHHLACR